MKKGLASRIVFIILTSLFAVLFMASIIGSNIANYNSAAINSYFDILPYRPEQVGDDEDTDTEYYKSSFVTAKGNYDDEALWDYDLRVAQQIVNEGCVLLWNDGSLPLKKESAVSCFANTSVDMVLTGTGSGSIKVDGAVNLRESLEKYGFKVNNKLWDFYEKGAGSDSAGYGLLQKGFKGIGANEALYTREVPWNVIEGDGVSSSFAEFGDAAIFVLGRTFGEGTYIREAGDYYLAVGNNAHDALNNILAVKGKTTADGMDYNGDASMVKTITFDETDTETYSVSEHTGEKIENLFDFADFNLYEYNDGQSVTYVTRNDWTGTLPTSSPRLTMNAETADMLKHLRDLEQPREDAKKFYEEHGEIKYEQKNGWSLIQMKDLPFDAPEWDELLDQMSWEEQAELCSNGYHTTALVESINKPATRDENGPLGISVTFSTMAARSSMGWPCEPTRAATFNKELSHLFGKCLGEDMLHAGVTGLWGYGLNMHRTPYLGRNFEYYSEDSFLAGETFDPTGTVLEAEFADGSKAEVTEGYSVSPTGVLTTDIDSVTFGLTVAGVTKTVTQSISVTEYVAVLERIEITKAPTKTQYLKGEAFDPNGMEVTAHFEDGNDMVVTDYTVSPDGTFTGDETYVTVSYTHGDVTKTVQQAIKVYTDRTVAGELTFDNPDNYTVSEGGWVRNENEDRQFDDGSVAARLRAKTDGQTVDGSYIRFEFDFSSAGVDDLSMAGFMIYAIDTRVRTSVEVSTDGDTFTQLFEVTGTRKVPADIKEKADNILSGGKTDSNMYALYYGVGKYFEDTDSTTLYVRVGCSTPTDSSIPEPGTSLGNGLSNEGGDIFGKITFYSFLVTPEQQLS